MLSAKQRAIVLVPAPPHPTTLMVVVRPARTSSNSLLLTPAILTFFWCSTGIDFSITFLTSFLDFFALFSFLLFSAAITSSTIFLINQSPSSE